MIWHVDLNFPFESFCLDYSDGGGERIFWDTDNRYCKPDFQEGRGMMPDKSGAIRHTVDWNRTQHQTSLFLCFHFTSTLDKRTMLMWFEIFLGGGELLFYVFP